MLISQRYKFIFIKTMKTAGTSIEVALSKYLGADDVITPIFEEDEPLRAAPGYRGPQNYLVPLRRWKRNDWMTFLRTRQRPQFHNHMAGRARDLAVMGGSSRYTINGVVAVDRIYKYENLQEAMRDLAARVGLPEIPQLPHAKSGFRKDRRPYRDLYGHAEREVVRDIFGGEIAALDYTF